MSERYLLWQCLRRTRAKRLLKVTYMEHACWSEAFAARMYGDNPDLSDDARTAYRWAEQQFVRIANGRIGERDLVG